LRKIPDHSVIYRARHERSRESDALRRMFESVMAMCIAAGLVGGEAFSVDASLNRFGQTDKTRQNKSQPPLNCHPSNAP